MTKKNTERFYLGGTNGISKAYFDKIKRWARDLPHGPENDEFFLMLMDAQADYLKRVRATVRAKNPQPKIPKRPKPEAQTLVSIYPLYPGIEYVNLSKDGDEDTRSNN